MKKLFKSAIAVIAVVIMACAFAGCTANVSGKTYEFSEVRIELPKDATEDQKSAANVVKGLVELGARGTSYTFKEDGKMGLGINTWKQEGKEVTIYAGSTETVVKKFNVNGANLEEGGEEDGYKFVIVYKAK